MNAKKSNAHVLLLSHTLYSLRAHPSNVLLVAGRPLRGAKPANRQRDFTSAAVSPLPTLLEITL